MICAHSLSVALSLLLSDATSLGWEKSGFVEAVWRYSEVLSAEGFNQLVDYLHLWADGRWGNKQRDKRKYRARVSCTSLILGLLQGALYLGI